MDTTFRRQVAATRESIAAVSAELAAWLDAERIPEPAALLARLAVDELLTNVLKYGYDDAAGHAIDVECTNTPDNFTVVVIDDGRPFNPLEVAEPVVEAAVEDREIGGLGLLLLRRLSDSFAYERRDGRNRVRLAKTHGS